MLFSPFVKGVRGDFCIFCFFERKKRKNSRSKQKNPQKKVQKHGRKKGREPSAKEGSRYAKQNDRAKGGK